MLAGSDGALSMDMRVVGIRRRDHDGAVRCRRDERVKGLLERSGAVVRAAVGPKTNVYDARAAARSSENPIERLKEVDRVAELGRETSFAFPGYVIAR